MSAEHGTGHSGESVTDIIRTLILCLFGMGYFLDKVKETIEETTGGGGGHPGH